MARIEIPITQVTRAGVEAPAQVAGSAAEGHFLAYTDGEVILEATNADAAATHKVTLLFPNLVDGQEITKKEIVVAKSKSFMIGPFPQAVYAQSNGQVWFNVDSAELKLRAWRA